MRLACSRNLESSHDPPSFYQGLLPALLQAPLCRFGDTAANDGALSLFRSSSLPLPLQTLAASVLASLWRAALTPLDTLKLVLEIEGASSGAASLRRRVAAHGLAALWEGAAGVALAAAASHWPWFGVHNALTAWFRSVPAATHQNRQTHAKRGATHALWRSAAIGFVATVASDCVANPMRVLKATVQTSLVPVSYTAAAAAIVAADGRAALFTRGLAAKLCINALQGVLFSVLWAQFKLMWTAHVEGRGLLPSHSARGGWVARAKASARSRLFVE